MSNPIAVALNTVDDVLPALPHMLGFYPTDSLVIVTMHQHQGGQTQLGATIRLDLPTPEEYAEFVGFLDAGTGPLQTLRPDALMLFVITDAEFEQAEGLPHDRLVEQLNAALPAAGFPVLTTLWTPYIRHGAQWVSYLDPTLHGTVTDPQASALGAELTAQGNVLFSSREDMSALIAPERDGATAAEWALKLDGFGLDDTHTDTDAVADRVQAIGEAVADIAGGEYPDEDSLVRMLHWISDKRVRDALLPTALGEHAGAAESLWVTLVRKAPAPEVAEVATLLAVATYVRGDGALTHIALDRALEADPAHTLAALLHHALGNGIPPSEFTQFLRDYTDTADNTDQ
ncbi:DUF4192 domain-containing protein [Saccharopolyspora tripterygii]